MLAASHLWAVCSEYSCLCKPLACALGHRKQKSVEGAREMSSLSDKIARLVMDRTFWVEHCLEHTLSDH